MKPLKKLLWDAEVKPSVMPVGSLIKFKEEGGTLEGLHRHYVYEGAFKRFSVYFLYNEDLFRISVPMENHKVSRVVADELKEIPDGFFRELITLRAYL